MCKMTKAIHILLLAANIPVCIAETHELRATPNTIIWGYYSAAAKPVLRVKSGDSVRIETVSGDPVMLEAGGIPPDQIPAALKRIHAEVKDKGPGLHILTGPIYIEGSEPGDVLEVRILRMELTVPYARNSFRPGVGFLPEEFPYTRSKIIPLDRERMIGRFSDSIEIPLRPFF